MSLATEGPEVVIKTGSMLNLWSSKLKVVAIMLGLAAYVYVLFSLKTAYMRSKRLDNIDTVALKNEKMIHHVHELDERLALGAARLRDYYEDY